MISSTLLGRKGVLLSAARSSFDVISGFISSRSDLAASTEGCFPGMKISWVSFDMTGAASSAIGDE